MNVSGQVKQSSESQDFPRVPWDGGTATFVADPNSLCAEPWAVVVFVLHHGRFLLSRVPRGWCTPSGRVEPGEAPEQAAIRETYEEAGATVRDLHRIGDFLILSEDGTSRCAAVFVGTLETAGPVPIGTESTDARLFRLEEIPALYWTWDPLMETMFQYALNRAGLVEGGGDA